MAKLKKRVDGYLKRSFSIGGRRYYVYGKTPEELFRKEKEKRDLIENGLEARKNPTVRQYFDRWEENRRGSVKEITIRGQIHGFEVISKVHISSANKPFGDLKMREITIDDMRIVQSELLKGRKTRSVNDYMAIIKHLFADAHKERLIDYNPALLLKDLKRTEEEARDTVHRALSIEEQKAFFCSDRAKQSFYYDIYRLAINTGMRIGEIGALKYSDIRDGFIHVERTITRTENGGYIVGDSAKTKAGKRTIPINAEIKEIIEHQKAINAMLDGNVVSMDNLLFRSVERGLLMSSPVDRELKRICKAAGIEHFTCHAFRATFATRCIESNMNIKTLMEIMGHNDIGMTMNLYGHCLENTKKEAMDNLHIAINF